MRKLIDADALKAEFTGNFQEEWHYTAIRAMIDVAPTVDAEPVKHGRWMSFEEYCQKLGADPKTYTGGWSFCSECEKPMRSYYGWNYCPNCGTKMDEVK